MSASSTTSITLFVMGAPGTGKTTVAKSIALNLGIHAYFSGDALREAAVDFPDLATRKTIHTLLSEGEPMPLEIYDAVMAAKLEKLQRPGIVVDGYPRTLEQCMHIPQILNLLGAGPRSVYGLLLIAPLAAIAGRVLNRRREDDSIEIFMQRLAGHNQTIDRIYERFVESWPVIRVDATLDVPAITSIVRRTLSH